MQTRRTPFPPSSPARHPPSLPPTISPRLTCQPAFHLPASPHLASQSEKEKLNALRASNSSLSFFLLTYCAGIVASAIQGLKASIFPAVEIPAAKPVVAEAAACQ